MLWNWYTIDACFISSDWHVTSNGGFAVSCLGVIGLVMALEFLRRLVMEYDIYLVRKRIDASSTNKGTVSGSQGVIVLPFKPTITEQSIRAGLYTAQFVVGYFVMLYVRIRYRLLHLLLRLWRWRLWWLDFCDLIDRLRITGLLCIIMGSSSCVSSLGHIWAALLATGGC